jgi:hypothetical protein
MLRQLREIRAKYADANMLWHAIQGNQVTQDCSTAKGKLNEAKIIFDAACIGGGGHSLAGSCRSGWRHIALMFVKTCRKALPPKKYFKRRNRA